MNPVSDDLPPVQAPFVLARSDPRSRVTGIFCGRDPDEQNVNVHAKRKSVADSPLGARFVYNDRSG